MTTDNLDLIGCWLDALNRTDWDEFAGMLSPDATFTFTHALPAESATLRGRDAVLASYTGWRRGFSELRGEIVDGFEAGDRAIVQLWWNGVAAESGNRIEFAACFLITIEDDRITRIVDFYDQLSYNEQFE